MVSTNKKERGIINEETFQFLIGMVSTMFGELDHHKYSDKFQFLIGMVSTN